MILSEQVAKDAVIAALRQDLDKTISDKDAEREDALSAMQQFMEEEKHEASRLMQQQIDGQLAALLESINKVDSTYVHTGASIDQTKSEVINYLRKSNNEKADSVLRLQKLVADRDAEIRAAQQRQREMFERGWAAARQSSPC